MSSSNAKALTGSIPRRPNAATKARFGNFVDEKSYQCDIKSTVINEVDTELLNLAVEAGLKLVCDISYCSQWDFCSDGGKLCPKFGNFLLPY